MVSLLVAPRAACMLCRGWRWLLPVFFRGGFMDRSTGAAAIARCLGVVRGDWCPARALWDDELGARERRVFLVAAGLPMPLSEKDWRELSEEARSRVKAAMLRFHRRFSGLLEKLAAVEEGANHVHG